MRQEKRGKWGEQWGAGGVNDGVNDGWMERMGNEWKWKEGGVDELLWVYDGEVTSSGWDACDGWVVAYLFPQKRRRKPSAKWHKL